MKKIYKLLIIFGGTFIVATLGSLITFPSISSWYLFLNKPVFSPPNFIFGPVWTILYILMATSAYLIWESRINKKLSNEALRFYAVQLVLNFLWSAIFFGLHNPTLALVDIVALWVLILMTMKKFAMISKVSLYLMIPYFLWVSFAAVLNLAIVILN